MPAVMIYTVQPGDTLGDIAARFDVPVSVIARINAIPNIDRIYPGQRLRIPARMPQPPRPPQRPDTQRYVVQPGDTLYSIAEANGTTVDALIRLNDIRTPNLIFPGQTLRLR